MLEGKTEGDGRSGDGSDDSRAGTGEERLDGGDWSAAGRSIGPPPRTKMNDGVKAMTAAEDTADPRPAAAYPTTATVWTTGPGVIWPKRTA